MDVKIENIIDLKSRIAVLKIKNLEDELYITQKYVSIKESVSSPFKFLRRMGEMIGIVHTGNNKIDKNPTKADWVTNFGRVFLPVLLNKTILRNRGVFLKALISLLSQRTINSKSFNKNVLANWIDKATNLVNSTLKTPKPTTYKDYGIPPESETY